MLWKHFTVLGMLLLSSSTEVQAQEQPRTQLYELISTTNVKAGPLLPITQDKALLLAFAAELTEAIYYKDPDPRFPDYTHLSYVNKYGSNAHFVESANFVDANLFLEVGNYCFVTWRGTLSMDIMDPITWQDWLFRNADAETKQASVFNGDPSATCSVHEGMYEAYQGGELSNNELEPHILQFVTECMNSHPNKQLVLAGHSQGAGAAQIGAIRLETWRPLTISLAGAPILKNESADCPLLNPDHIWRVVNTENEIDGTHLLLDNVRFVFLVFLACIRWCW
jgi:hypothetical protein